MIETCSMPILLANVCLLYTMSCIYYLVQTRNIGTPFKKSLYNFQRKIKEEAVLKRKSIFVQGIFVSAILLALWHPFKNC